MPPGSNLEVSISVMREGKEKEIIPFEGTQIFFGRDKECDVSLPDASVSRHHAELRREGGTFTLIDTESRNGLRVNGVPRKQASILPGDTFEIGIYTFRLRAGQGSKLSSRLSLTVSQRKVGAIVLYLSDL